MSARQKRADSTDGSGNRSDRERRTPRLFVVGDSTHYDGPYLERYCAGAFEYNRRSGVDRVAVSGTVYATSYRKNRKPGASGIAISSSAPVTVSPESRSVATISPAGSPRSAIRLRSSVLCSSRKTVR